MFHIFPLHGARCRIAKLRKQMCINIPIEAFSHGSDRCLQVALQRSVSGASFSICNTSVRLGISLSSSTDWRSPVQSSPRE
ncbi:MAG: hypothetical protein ACLSFW_23085 [Bacteroides cellulosilyticus]